MPTAVKSRRTPIWRKVTILVLLPVITLLWMTGWILTQLGSQGNSKEIRPKTMLTQTTYQTNNETKTPQKDEDSQIPYRPEIIA